MTDETEVLRIKREALEGLRDWTRSRVETVRDVTQYLREVLPPHAPRKVRAKIMLHDFGEGSSKGFLHSQGSHDSWAVSYGDTILGIHRDDFARMAELVARADADGMVEEGLGAAAPKSECQAGEVASTHVASPTDHSDSPAPSPAPARDCSCGHSFDCHAVTLGKNCIRCPCVQYAPDARPQQSAPAPAETREWRVMVDATGWIMDGRSLGASDVRLSDAECPQDAPHELLDVVPRASLEATEAARRTDVATIQATADALYGDNNRPPAWQSGMPGAVGAMREERDQFQKAYDAAERHNTILRENVERHGDTIRTIRAQLREALGRINGMRAAVREAAAEASDAIAESVELRARLAVNEISRFVDSNDGEYHAMQTMVPTATGPTLAALGHALPNKEGE